MSGNFEKYRNNYVEVIEKKSVKFTTKSTLVDNVAFRSWSTGINNEKRRMDI